MPDCLICLETTQEDWTPLTPCDCHPILHRTCWKEWVLQSGAVCIICRQIPEKEDAEEQQDEQIAQRPIAWVDPYKEINNMLFFRFCALILFYLSVYGVSTSAVHDEL